VTDTITTQSLTITASPPRAQRGSDVAILALCTAAILISRFMLVHAEEGVSFTSDRTLALPSLCAFRALSGLNCPGCGLTRSFIALSHGDWRGAWQFNPVGLLVYALVLLQFPYRAIRLLSPSVHLRTEKREQQVWPAVMTALVAFLVVNWLVYVATRIAGQV